MISQLVFYTDNSVKAKIFTTDEVIAECSNNSLNSVKRLIRNHKKRLERFGPVGFEIRAGSAHKKTYHLNEPQTTLLITYLDNTEVAADFKVELVAQFFAMRDLLRQRIIARETSKPATKSMTDTIKEKGLDSHMYVNYNRLALKVATGCNSQELKRQRGIPKSGVITDYLTDSELDRLTKAKQNIATLIDLEMPYDVIKALVGGTGVITLDAKEKQRKGA